MKPRTPFVMLWLVIFLTACGPEAWEREPVIQAAKKTCKGLDEGKRYDCIERHAVETLNPDVCRLAGIWIDDTFASLSAGILCISRGEVS